MTATKVLEAIKNDARPQTDHGSVSPKRPKKGPKSLERPDLWDPGPTWCSYLEALPKGERVEFGDLPASPLDKERQKALKTLRRVSQRLKSDAVDVRPLPDFGVPPDLYERASVWAPYLDQFRAKARLPEPKAGWWKDQDERHKALQKLGGVLKKLRAQESARKQHTLFG